MEWGPQSHEGPRSRGGHEAVGAMAWAQRERLVAPLPLSPVLWRGPSHHHLGHPRGSLSFGLMCCFSGYWRRVDFSLRNDPRAGTASGSHGELYLPLLSF